MMKSLSNTLAGALLLFGVVSAQVTVPYTFVNTSTFPDDQIYIAVIGITGGHVWIDGATGQVNQMSVNDNTLQGPIIGGNTGPGGNAMYADCFTKLSDIPNKIIPIPNIAGSRILIGFGSPLYMYFFGYSGAPSGYAAPDLANPTNPNQGIRFEMVELTNNQYGIWSNTTRVDSYQYPMGLEIWGANGFYNKTGEVMNQDWIINSWKSDVSAAFQGCLKESEKIIMAPSKIADFQPGGSQANFFQPYVDAVWEKYKNEDLTFNSGNAGVWKGRVVNEQFVFHNLTNSFGNATAYITRRPNTQEVLEGKGVLAENVQNLPTQTLDLVVQAQFCAALNRHAIDLNAASGTTQDWSDSSKYFRTMPYNEYVKFWHRADVSWNQSSYGFCYDDVFEYSSTIHTPSPTNATVSIGGFYTPPVSLVPGKSRKCSVTQMGLDASRTVVRGNDLDYGFLTVFDGRGQEVAAAPYTAGSARLDHPLATGTYLWRLTKAQGIQGGQLRVER